MTSGSLVVPRIYTLAGDALPLRGAALGASETFAPGAVAWENGVITYAGPAEGLAGPPDEELRDACVAPGFVDCHTHLPFFGWRDDEFEARLTGVTYRDAQRAGGGIPRSARMLAAASDDEVFAFCIPLAREMAEHGTIALELKTGYGGSLEGELRQVRLARELAERIPQTCTVTLLACHTVPEGFAREEWVSLVVEQLLPAVASDGLADAVDIYVEDIAFSVQDLRAVGAAARDAGLPLRCHADQLGASGAAEESVTLGARSADHLNNVSETGVEALGSAKATVAVLLPASSMMMGAAAAPARRLVDAGAAVAFATDFNPGSCPVLSMPETIAIGCSTYGLSPGEALGASTANPAWVLGLDERLGTLEPGKRADFVVLKGEDVRRVPYRPGHNPVQRTYIDGDRVF